MSRNFKLIVAVGSLLAAPLALAQQKDSKRVCEAKCDKNAEMCEEMILKKLGEGTNAATKTQAKKMCSDAAKGCKKKC